MFGRTARTTGPIAPSLPLTFPLTGNIRHTMDGGKLVLEVEVRNMDDDWYGPSLTLWRAAVVEDLNALGRITAQMHQDQVKPVVTTQPECHSVP